MSRRSAGDSRRETGRLGEQAADAFLRDGGYRIVARNWRCRRGELDLIAEHDDCLVFVEVRTRQFGGGFGTPAESVDHRKQRRIRQLAHIYLMMNPAEGRTVRFDVIAVQLERDGLVQQLDHYRNAF